LFCTNFKGKLAAELMNKQRYDGMSLSNHELDNALERPCCTDPRLTVRMRLS
jgi:2',3'-cyclic-nucleotide 2'-phosphodiesterase (5'-nucleotidase family)